MNASGSMAVSKPARTFQDLLVWQKAHAFVLEAYAVTAVFPKQETYGLALQMRRAAVSIPANITEGFRRRGKADKARFLNIAEGSVEECRYFLSLTKDLGYGDTQSLSAALEEVSKLLGAYTAAILASGSWLLTPDLRAWRPPSTPRPLSVPRPNPRGPSPSCPF